MLTIRKTVWALLGLLILLSAAPIQQAAATPLDVDVPPGFFLVTGQAGVQLYRKNYPNGTPDFVQVIDLSQGAGVKPLHGKVSELRPGKGMFGGNDARIASRRLIDFWDDFRRKYESPFCVTNGQFFFMSESPTRLPFALKTDGEVITDGFGKNDHPGQWLMLEIWENQVDIGELSQATLYGSTAPDIVAGLTEDANKRALRSVGRTFVGIDDRNSDGFYEVVLIFNTRSAKQQDAAEVLKSFGADKVMMLDGGGSTQLICEGTSYVSSDRYIPQALGSFAGSGQVVAAPAAEAKVSGVVLSYPGVPVLIEGEDLPVSIEVENTGNGAWEPGALQLVVEKNLWGEEERLNLTQAAEPGQRVAFSWQVPAFEKWSIYSANWYLARGEEKIDGDPVRFRIIVLPADLKNRRADLENKLEAWSDEQGEDLETFVLNWVQEQRQPVVQRVVTALAGGDIRDLLWIPATIIPVAGLLLVAIFRIRQRPA